MKTMTTAAGRLNEEAQQVIAEVRDRRYAQRFLNIVMLLAIAALFILVMNYSAGGSVIQDNSAVLNRVCMAADPNLLNISDRQTCEGVTHGR